MAASGKSAKCCHKADLRCLPTKMGWHTFCAAPGSWEYLKSCVKSCCHRHQISPCRANVDSVLIVALKPSERGPFIACKPKEPLEECGEDAH
jgi:hypothetical protein